jgi:hypothetical protein
MPFGCTAMPAPTAKMGCANALRRAAVLVQGRGQGEAGGSSTDDQDASHQGGSGLSPGAGNNSLGLRPRYPIVGRTPSCCSMLNASSSPISSATLPQAMRKMLIPIQVAPAAAGPRGSG